MQLDLFADLPQKARPKPGRKVPPAPPLPEHVALAEKLPPGVYLGTSSWTFPGWAGIVYGRVASQHSLAQHGLAAYTAHPLLRGVGLDRTFYTPLAASEFAAYAAQTPPGFRFLVKAHLECTVDRFPQQAKYGAAAGKPNRRFLDPGYAAEAVIGPTLEGLGPRAGPIVFQFPPQDFGNPDRFAERLHGFLRQLPRAGRYAVELRTRGALVARYFEVLADLQVSHCLNGHPTMPGISVQGRLAAAASPALVIRWMLRPGMNYEQAARLYSPFDRLVDEDGETRAVIARLCVDAARAGKEAFVTINNKAEGSAPLSVFRLAESVVERNEGPAGHRVPAPKGEASETEP